MESDRAKLEKLLTEFGVGFTGNGSCIVCRESLDEKVHGYSGFFVKFEFDVAGTFIQVGVWE